MVLIVFIPVLIGTYVYKDAKSRNMDAFLWTLVSILMPGFLGLIIYLIIRTNSTTQGSSNSEETIVKNRNLALVIMAVAVALILSLIIGMGGLMYLVTAGETSWDASQSQINLEEESYLPDDVVSWVNQCDTRGKGVYVLKLSSEKASQIKFLSSNSDDEATDLYFFYLNQYKGSNQEKIFVGGPKVEENILTISYEIVNGAREESIDYELSAIRIYGGQIDDLKFIVDGEEVEFSVSELK